VASNASVPEEWSREIRGWLLGRLGKGLTTGESPAAEANLHGRALAWWVFEGKRHRFLDGPLSLRTVEVDREIRRLDAVLSPEWSVEESPAAETDWVRTALRRPTDPVPRFVVRASSSGLTDLEREALHGWRRYTADLWRGYTAELGVPAGAPETLPWQPEEEPEPVSPRQLHRWAQAARRSRWPLLREVVAETFRAAVEPESIDRLPLPSGRESVFELLCVVRLLDALHGPGGQIRLLGDGEDLAGIRLPGLTCRYQGWLGGERLSDEELGAPCVCALERHGVVLPRRFDALVTFEKPRAGFHGILLEAKSGAQSFADTVHQLKAYRAALKEQLPGPLLVWGVVEGGGDRTKPFDRAALRDAALTRREGDDFWLFTSEDEIRDALEALSVVPSAEDGGYCRWTPEDEKEGRIYTACALRFDGYRWLQERAGSEEAAGGLRDDLLRDFFGRESYDRPLEELLLVFFIVQRWFIKEAWLRWDEQLARVTRRLFRQTCGLETPSAFRDEDCDATWRTEYQPRLQDLQEFVRRRGAETTYEPTPVLARHFGKP
jgi:hypothetical protein